MVIGLLLKITLELQVDIKVWKNENKKEILIYDYFDDNFAKTIKMFLKRKNTYEKLGYEMVGV